jgi:hypothetical protein
MLKIVKIKPARIVQCSRWTYTASCNENSVQRVTEVWLIACKLWLQLFYMYLIIILVCQRASNSQKTRVFMPSLLHFFHGAMAAGRPGPPYYRGFTITLRHTSLGKTLLDEWLPDAKISTWIHRTLTWYRYPCPRRDSNPQPHINSSTTKAMHSGYWHRNNIKP